LNDGLPTVEIPTAKDVPGAEPEANFTTLFREGLELGDEPGQVDFSDLAAAGGVEGVLAEERFKKPGLREINEVLETLLGKTTGTQRSAPDIEEMSSWQKGLLFVSDITAVSEGRMPPSMQLREEYARSLTLQDKAAQEGFIKAIPAIRDFTNLIGRLDPEDRMEAAAQQIPRVRKIFGEGFGSLLFKIASEPSTAEGVQAFLENQGDLYEGGASESLMKMAAFLAGTGEWEKAVDLFSQTGLGENGVFAREARSKAPAMVMAKMDGFLDELRERGGDSGKFANRLEQRERITPDELINQNKSLALNSEFRFSDLEIRTIGENPELFAAAIPGTVTWEQEQEYYTEKMKGNLSELVNFIGGESSEEPGRVEMAPITGDRARWLANNGYVRLDSLTGLEGSSVPSAADNLRMLGMFLDESQPYKDMIEHYNTLKSVFNRETPGSDMAMVFGIMKMFDRASVVRETEQRQAKEMGAIADKMKAKNLWLKAAKGRGLNEQQRQDIMDVANDIWLVAARRQADVERRFGDTADAMGFDKRAVMQDLIGADRPKNIGPSPTITSEVRTPTKEDIKEAQQATQSSDPKVIGRWLLENDFNLDEPSQ